MAEEPVRRPGLKKLWSFLATAYLVGLVCITLAMHLAGDRWWMATVVLFGPRWFFPLPLVVIAAGALLLRMGMWKRLVLAGVLAIGPLMGFEVPFRLPGETAQPLRVITCNVAGGAARPEALLELVAAENPSLLFLQEFGNEKDLEFLKENGWEVRNDGRLGLASAYPIEQVDYHVFDAGTEVARYELRMPWGPMIVYNVHLPTARWGLDQILDRRTLFRPAGVAGLRAEIARRSRDSQQTAEWIAGFDDAALIAGDFNMPPESRLFDLHWAKYQNAFSTAGWGLGRTRPVSMHGIRYGVRIDHVLAGSGYEPVGARVGFEIGSDHRPLIAEFDVK